MLHLLRARLRHDGTARVHAVFQPGGADVGNVAHFKITGYRDPVPARY
jgi:hypothetical protein